MSRWIGPMVAAAMTTGAALSAQAAHSGGAQEAMTHDMSSATQGTGRESGQAAFAALSETVATISADPSTDWSKVNIDALRDHLVDMDNVTLRSRVTTTALADGARFTISGDGTVAKSIQRMVGNHAGMADPATGWAITAANNSDGAVMTVTSTDPKRAAMVTKLGFFGVMATGNHHQLHHLMVAKGGMSH